MRHIPEDLAARVESGAATLCHVWRLRRADGATMGFTDHDRDLVVDGVVCRAASGWTAGAGESAVGLAAGSVSAAGALDDAAITEADVAAGLYDQASVELWRVDWTQTTLKVRLWVGTLARIRRENALEGYRPSNGLSAGTFVAELEGPLAGCATRGWGTSGAGSRRRRGGSATSGGTPASGRLRTASTFAASPMCRATIS